MARLQDCKKGMYIAFSYQPGARRFRIRKVNKNSVTINQKVNFGTGMLITPHREHYRVVRERELSSCALFDEGEQL